MSQRPHVPSPRGVRPDPHPEPVEPPQEPGDPVLAALRHALMQQVWDSTDGFRRLDTLAVANGVIGNPELLDALIAYHQRPAGYVVVREEGGVLSDPEIVDDLAQANTMQGIADGYAPPGVTGAVYALTDITERTGE